MDSNKELVPKDVEAEQSEAWDDINRRTESDDVVKALFGDSYPNDNPREFLTLALDSDEEGLRELSRFLDKWAEEIMPVLFPDGITCEPAIDNPRSTRTDPLEDLLEKEMEQIRREESHESKI